MARETIDVDVNYANNPGEPSCQHEWAEVNDHPRGGDFIANFMMESEEVVNWEMCLKCSARRLKPGKDWPSNGSMKDPI